MAIGIIWSKYTVVDLLWVKSWTVSHSSNDSAAWSNLQRHVLNVINISQIRVTETLYGICGAATESVVSVLWSV